MKKIMFNDDFDLTKAVLEGRKIQTRRIIKRPKDFKRKEIKGYFYAAGKVIDLEDDGWWPVVYDGQLLPFYKVDEIVAVAQCYYDCESKETTFPKNSGYLNKMFVRAELMPHQIRITKIRMEHLQDISEEDCLAEGVITRWHAPCCIRYYYITDPESGTKYDVYSSAREAYAALIDKVSGKGTWESNPWVWVYDFELVKQEE